MRLLTSGRTFERKGMKTVAGAMFVILVYAAMFALLIWMTTDAVDSLALIGKCQRVTNMSFFECGNMTTEQLQAISASSTGK